jgi:hypothetical protein
MRHETLDSHLGRPIAIDLCLQCHAFWFDARESLRLSPGSTLKLFRVIGDATSAGSARPAAATAASCPRCGTRLRRTRDMQRSTRFEYFSCPNGHGRLTTFFNFLREKNFIKPLSPAQIAELRRTVQTTQCANCGAPIDLARGTACTHCGSPLSMLDLGQAEQLIGQLRAADQRKATVDPALPLSLARAERDVHAAFDAFERDPGQLDATGSLDLVAAGVAAVARWLKGPGR